MECDVINIMATQGAFALLFSYLLFYVLKENSKREESYQNIIKNLSDSIPEIETAIHDIKNTINEGIRSK